MPGSDVTQHAKIDLDQKDMEAALGAKDYALAKKWCTDGGNSNVEAPFRTLQGFSTSAQRKMYDGCPGCPYKTYSKFYNYYGSHTYADDWALAALDGTGMTFASGKFSPNNFATLWMNVWMYVVREFEDAIDGCTSCDSDCNVHSTNSGSVHAWDEGVAFYTGSPEGTAYGGSSAGKLLPLALTLPL